MREHGLRGAALLAALLLCQPAFAQAVTGPERARITERIAELRRIHTPDGIELLEPVPIGGTPQWISVRGKDRRAPVIVVIHGGPGTPNLPMAWAYQTPWEDFFTVVQYDQRGLGKNAVGADRDVLTPTLTFDRLVADAEEVVAWARQRLGAERVVVLGYSYGTRIALALAERRPAWISAYVGTGQMAAALLTRKWARQFDGGWYGKPTFDLLFSLPDWAPEYTDADLAAQADASRWFSRTVSGTGAGALPERVAVPVVVIQGRHDLHTPYEPARAYIERLEAPRKRFVTLEHSAHVPFLEEPGRFLQALLSEVLPLATGTPAPGR